MASYGQIALHGKGNESFRVVWKDGIAYRGYTQDSRLLMVPHWTVIAAAAVLPGWRAGRWIVRRKKRAPQGCAGCGYDLRMHKAGEKCPECGKEIAAPAAMA
jgi:hypothetical protein